MESKPREIIDHKRKGAGMREKENRPNSLCGRLLKESARRFRASEGEGGERLQGRYYLFRFSHPPDRCKNPYWPELKTCQTKP